MLNLEEFQRRMEEELKKTRDSRTVQVSGKNLDEALEQASVELSLPVKNIDYEILDKGNPGFFGIKSRPCRIIAYQAAKPADEERELSLDEQFNLQSYEQDSVEINKDVDGKFSVRLASDGAWLKVFPPKGDGMPVEKEEVIQKLNDRNVFEIDVDMVQTVIEQADEMWIKVGDFEYNPANSALTSLEVSKDEMEAYITVTPPGPGGSDLTVDDIKGFLSNNSIVYGILMDALQDFEDFPVYNTPYLVAEGTPPVDGKDAKIIYNFETEPDKVHIQEKEDGSVDFKELNKFQNVVKGQPLARKIPPEPGKDGRTVYGRYIPAKDGKDLEILLGKNVELTDNGSTVIASASGHVMLKNGRITVETVLVIPGNVDARTGNVNALGSVVIKGNVEDGYSVAAEGKIEVSGYVGKANLNAGGDIIVSRGINGGDSKEFGNIISGKTIWSSFLQNAQAEAGEFIIVSSGVINSNVFAQRKVLCKGKKAKIVGGKVRATEEVNAVTIGSPSGTETIIEVGFDPKAKEELDLLEQKREALDEERDKVDLNIQGIKRQALMKKQKLSKEKAELFEELRRKHNDLIKQIKQLDEEIEKKKEYIESLTVLGKISASKRILSGVVIRIRDKEERITAPYDQGVTFILEDDFIKRVRYQDIEEDLTRR